MRNVEQWQPSKFVTVRGRLTASRNLRELSPVSRVIARAIAERYDEALRVHARGRLLDLGCGKVPLYATYRPYVDEVMCVDWAGSLHGSAHIDVACDLNEPLPLESGSFDTIIFSDVLEHLPRPEAVMQEIARLLRSGGKLLLNVPFFYWIHEAPFDFHRYTEFALRRLVELSGLKLELLTELGGAPEIIGDLLGRSARRIPVLGGPLAWLIGNFSLFFTRLPGVTHWSRSSARFVPYGYFLVASKP